jgi:LytS/YehU family sensor histidine kinase
LWLQMPGKGFADGVDWLTMLSRMYSQSGEKIVTFVGTVILSAVYYLKDSRTSGALAVAQLGLSHARKRRLTEELRRAQAALDPDFLFATLAEVDRRFDGDPMVAQRLLDALIRYLRAALPAKDDSIGTLGQQATLVRAYLEIESIRSGGLMQGIIDMPSELESRLFAPALILPLVALAAGDVAGSGRDARIHVRVSLASGRLTVEVRCDGCQPWATAEQETTLVSLRHRVGALYGSRAELSFATRAPRGSTARIVIDDPGSL